MGQICMLAPASLTLLLLAGCAVQTAEVSDGADRAEDIGTAAEAATIDNGLTWNALTQNSLTQNSLTQNSLTQNSLTQNSLTQNSLVMSALTDSSARQLFSYVVSCALPSSNQINLTIGGTPYTFNGQLGVACSWQWGLCDAQCQQAVSSCVLARVNYYGQRVEISMRSCLLGALCSEQSAYPNEEATYWGNIFVQPQQRYTCLAPGKSSIPRVCGPSLDGCVVQSVGTCNCLLHTQDHGYDLCTFPGTTSAKPVTIFLAP